ncbi:MAG: S41 family peptidase [Planctomycetota bacterium]|jgi:tricorn protease
MPARARTSPWALGLLALGCVLPPACAATSGPAPEPIFVSTQDAVAPVPGRPAARPGLPQHPALAPDGSSVVFSWAGDLWWIPREGGAASRLTTHTAREGRAAFHPDGARLAFESNRNGTTNLYLMNLDLSGSQAQAGAVERVTLSDRAQSFAGWTGDGERLLFSSWREPGIYRSARPFSADLEAGPVTRVTDAFGSEPQVSADSTQLLLTRGRDNGVRPAYRGPGSSTIWSKDVASGEWSELAPSDASQSSPHFGPDGSIVFLSSRDGQNNVWRQDAGGGLTQLTNFQVAEGSATQGHGVRDLDVSHDGATAVFCVWDQLYTLDLASPGAAPVALEVTCGSDRVDRPVRTEDLSREAEEVALSPDGKTAALIARGELFVRPVEEGRPARRVTETAGRERDVRWSPDGSTLYFSSDEGGRRGLWTATVALSREDLEPEDESDEETEEAPEEPADEQAGAEGDADAAGEGDDAPEEEAEAEDDVDHGARWEDALRFDVQPFLSDPDAELWQPQPSPDGERLVYLRGLGDLIVRELETGAERVVLESWDDPDVQWVRDSRHLLYAVSDLDFNMDIWLLDVGAPEDTDWTPEPINLTQHPDIDHTPRLSADGKVLTFLSERAGENWRFDVWQIYLDRSLEDLSDWELERYYEEAASAFKADKLPEEPFEFYVDGAYLRARQITRYPASESELVVSPAADRILFQTSVDGSTGYWSVDRKGRDRKSVASSSVDGARLTPDGKRVQYVAGGSGRSAGFTGSKSETHGLSAEIVVDVLAEQAQKFGEAARVLGDGFYHPTLKGLDWAGLTEAYGSLAAQTHTAEGFNRVVGMLFGELDGSHLGISGGATYRADGADTGYLGVTVEPVAGGYRVREVIEGSPAHHPSADLQVGDVIQGVEGQMLAEGDALPSLGFYRALAERAGQETLVDVRRASGDTDTLLMTPISWNAERDLRYAQVVADRRRAVDAASGGRLGYLHIRSMSQPSVREFERDLYAAAHGRDGLLIDVRDNGGGSTTDILLASLTAPVHAYTVPRGADADSVPRDAYPRDRRLIYGYSRPIAVLINENSFSNAEIFAHSIRTTGRGRLVGTQTFGGVISTGSRTLIDGSRVRMPFRGWYLPDGTDMENNGAMPDLDVPRLPGDEEVGTDRQLLTAVEDLLKQL